MNNNTHIREETLSVSRSFNPNVARDLGTDSAIILRNIEFWVKKEEAGQRKEKYHEGKYWTYNSAVAFKKLFEWLTPRQISRNLEKLEKENYVVVANFNKHKYDRTKWYSLGEEYYNTLMYGNSPNGEMDSSKVSNALVNSDQPIPNIKPNKTKYISNIDSTASAGLTTKKELGNLTLAVNDKKRLLSFKKYIGGLPVSTYAKELGSGLELLVPLTHVELYDIAVKKQVSPQNIFLTYEEVLNQIESGEIPKKYKFNNTYNALSRWVDNKLRFEVYEYINELQTLELNDWTTEKLIKQDKLDMFKKKLKDRGEL